MAHREWAKKKKVCGSSLSIDCSEAPCSPSSRFRIAASYSLSHFEKYMYTWDPAAAHTPKTGTSGNGLLLHVIFAGCRLYTHTRTRRRCIERNIQTENCAYYLRAEMLNRLYALGKKNECNAKTREKKSKINERLYS